MSTSEVVKDAEELELDEGDFKFALSAFFRRSQRFLNFEQVL